MRILKCRCEFCHLKLWFVFVDKFVKHGAGLKLQIVK